MGSLSSLEATVHSSEWRAPYAGRHSPVPVHQLRRSRDGSLSAWNLLHEVEPVSPDIEGALNVNHMGAGGRRRHRQPCRPCLHAGFHGGRSGGGREAANRAARLAVPRRLGLHGLSAAPLFFAALARLLGLRPLAFGADATMAAEAA